MSPRVVALVVLLGTGCRSASEGAHAPTPPPNDASGRGREAGPDADVSDGGAATRWTLRAMGAALAAVSERGLFVGYPKRGASEPLLTLRRVEGARDVVETSRRGPCFRTAQGVAHCDGKVVARDVRSIAAYPYVLHVDGRVSVAPDRHATEVEHAMRERVAKSLPPLERLVAAEHVTCGLTGSGEVWCFPEPSYPFSKEVQVPQEPRAKRVPGIDATAIELQPWLTLCAITRDARVACSPAPLPTEVCVLRGPSQVRCGPQTSGPRLPQDLVGPGYDPRAHLERPLVLVPGIERARELQVYRRLAYHMGESARRTFVSDFDEGGCARLEDGTVHCFERDTCKKGSPWRSAPVAGLPHDIESFTLTGDSGFAIAKGDLWSWPRRASEPQCDAPAAFALRAEKLPTDVPVSNVGGGVFVAESLPAFQAIDCLAFVDGSLACSRTGAGKPRRFEPVQLAPSKKD